MPVRDWRQADDIISAAMRDATREQLELARTASLRLDASTPSIIAAALLRLRLCEQLKMSVKTDSPRETTIEWIQELWQGAEPPIVPETQEEADAWVDYLFLARNRESIRQLQLSEGDVVATSDGLLAEVSSIGDDGRVYFRGGCGFKAWPDRLALVARTDDRSVEASDARRQARNIAAERRPRTSWSLVRHEDLSDFEVVRQVTRAEVAQFESVLDSSADERPIQKYLGENPHLLTALLGRSPSYCLPLKRLGAEYVPDFIVGDVDSLGVHWLLVELESPKAKMYLKDGKTLGEKAREGYNQIVQWREWLSDNIAYARRPRRENGLGLYDIRERTRALVLVGRRSTLEQENAAVRHDLRQSSGIEMHTYDWLLQSLRGVLEFSGPPVLNPHLVERETDTVQQPDWM